MTQAELAAKIKAKYPEYAGIPDDVLITKIVAKYPEYKAHLTPVSSPTPPAKTPIPTEPDPADPRADPDPANPVMRLLAGVGRGIKGTLQFGADVAMMPAKAALGMPTVASQTADASIQNLQGAATDAGQGNLLSATAKLGGSIPVVGPGMLDAGQRAADTGDYAGLAGELAGPAIVGGAARVGLPKAAGMVEPVGRRIAPAVEGIKSVAKDYAPAVSEVVQDRMMGAGAGATIGGYLFGPPGALIGGFGGAVLAAKRGQRAAAAKLAETDSFKGAKIESRTLDAVDRGRAQSVKAAETDSMASGGIEARILEASQKTQAAVQQEVAIATERVRIATVKNRAKAEADLRVAQAKEAAAAKRVEEASQRAEAAQFKREWKQRTQLDKQAAKSAPAPAQAAAPASSGAIQGSPAPTVPATPAPPAISAPTIPAELATKARKSVAAMLYSDKPPAVADMATQLRKSHPALTPEAATQLATEAKARVVHSETLATGLAQQGESIQNIARTLYEYHDLPTSKAVELAVKLVRMREPGVLSAAQKADLVKLKGVTNIRKLGLDLTPR